MTVTLWVQPSCQKTVYKHFHPHQKHRGNDWRRNCLLFESSDSSACFADIADYSDLVLRQLWRTPVRLPIMLFFVIKKI